MEARIAQLLSSESPPNVPHSISRTVKVLVQTGLELTNEYEWSGGHSAASPPPSLTESCYLHSSHSFQARWAGLRTDRRSELHSRWSALFGALRGCTSVDLIGSIRFEEAGKGKPSGLLCLARLSPGGLHQNAAI